jgi:hypothetical protein
MLARTIRAALALAVSSLAALSLAACAASAPPADAALADAALPVKEVTLRATVSPTAACASDALLLQVTVLGFRLVPLTDPAQPGRGHYLLSFVDARGDALASLLKGSTREQRFRLADLPGFVAPPPGSYGLRLSLHLNDGTAAHADKWVTLPFELRPCGA